MDQAQLDEIQVDSTTCVPAEGWQGIIPREGNGGCTSSSPESSSVNGDARRAGKRQRRRKRSSRGESKAVGAEERLSHGDSHRLSPGPSSMLLGLQAETIWFSRSAYEQAEGSYQRWLVSSACKASAPGGSSPHQALCQETLQGPPPAAPMVSEQPADCHQANQEVCYHLVNKPVFNSAERNFMERAAPGPLPLAPGGGPSVQPTPDEGYLTLAPTPATPSPVARQESINGLPRFPAQLLTGVWLEKPRYDLAESAFYQRLYGLSPGPVPVGAEPLVTKDTRRGAEVVKEQNRPGPKEDGTTPRDNTMSAVQYLTQEKIWFEKPTYDEAEKRLYEGVNGPTHQTQETGANTILQDIARARENIQKSLAGLKTTLHPGKGSSCPPKNRQVQPSTVPGAGDHGEIITRMKNLELENQSLHRVVEDLRSALSKLEARVAVLEKVPAAAASVAAAAPCAKAIPVQQPKVRAPVEEVDDDLDLFGSDEEEDAEAERIREERVKAYTERKAKKPAIIAKSSILLDVKPWDDETDMAKLEECVRSVQADGLVWGTSKLVPVGYGIRKLQIQCVVEDDKVGTDMLEEEITRFEDYVQSVDVAAFNKI